jgi:hypothetical protein
VTGKGVIIVIRGSGSQLEMIPLDRLGEGQKVAQEDNAFLSIPPSIVYYHKFLPNGITLNTSFGTF